MGVQDRTIKRHITWRTRDLLFYLLMDRPNAVYAFHTGKKKKLSGVM